MANISITFLGHASFKFTSENGTISYLDPWLDDNPTATVSKSDIDKADIVMATHGHTDHFGDCYDICKKTNATFVGDYELSEAALGIGIAQENIYSLNPGGSVKLNDLNITMTQAQHSHSLSKHVLPAPLPEGMLYHAGGNVAGFIMSYDNGITIYNSSDTGVFSDMQLISQMYRPQIAILPVGGKFTMGVREATKAASFIRADIIIPCHYGEEIGQPADINRLVEQVEFACPGSKVVPIKTNQTLIYTSSSHKISN